MRFRVVQKTVEPQSRKGCVLYVTELQHVGIACVQMSLDRISEFQESQSTQMVH